jgi:hypothetical protein
LRPHVGFAGPDEPGANVLGICETSFQLDREFVDLIERVIVHGDIHRTAECATALFHTAR